jgi:cobalamin biosynthesis protein CobD/CbiB
MVSTLAYLPFRIVWRPTVWVGRVVAWLAEGYRTATPLERVLIFPSWAVLRGVFIAGWALSQLLHAAARRSVERYS